MQRYPYTSRSASNSGGLFGQHITPSSATLSSFLTVNGGITADSLSVNGAMECESLTSTGPISATNITCTGQLRITDSSPATPALAFDSNRDCGLELNGSSIRIVCEGNEDFRFEPTRMLSLQQFQSSFGTAAAPAYAFNTAGSTGVYGTATSVGVSTAGTQRLNVNATQLTSANPLFCPNGNVSAPAHSFTNFPTTGGYAATDFYGIGVNGAAGIGISTSNVTAAKEFIAADGILVRDASTGSTNLMYLNGDHASFDVPIRANQQLTLHNSSDTSTISSPQEGDMIYFEGGNSGTDGSPCLAVYTGSVWKTIPLANDLEEIEI